MRITKSIYHFGMSNDRKKMKKYERIGMDLTRKEISERNFIKRQLINTKGNICAICGKPILNMKDVTIDHIIPISLGGLTTIENCQLAHSKCNLEKGNSLLLTTYKYN